MKKKTLGLYANGLRGSAPLSSSSSSATPVTSPPQPPVSDGPTLTMELSVLLVLFRRALVSTVHGRRLLKSIRVIRHEVEAGVQWRGDDKERGTERAILWLSGSERVGLAVCRIENESLALLPTFRLSVWRSQIFSLCTAPCLSSVPFGNELAPLEKKQIEAKMFAMHVSLNNETPNSIALAK